MEWGRAVAATLLGRMENPLYLNVYISILHRKFETNIPIKGIALPQSQFPHSCVCERSIYSHDRSAHKVFSYVEYRVVSGVFQNIDPPPHPLSTLRVFPPTASEAGGTHSPGGEGVGVNILEDARHLMGLLTYNRSTDMPIMLQEICGTILGICKSLTDT